MALFLLVNLQYMLVPAAAVPAVVPGGEPVPAGVPQHRLVRVPGEPVGLTAELGLSRLYDMINYFCVIRGVYNTISIPIRGRGYKHSKTLKILYYAYFFSRHLSEIFG